MTVRVLAGDCRDLLPTLPAGSVQACVTSPPYLGHRDYGVDGQIGVERSVADYIAALVDVFRLVRDVMADDGTLWLNIGDTYAARADAGVKPKDLVGVPWRVALALQADGWWLRRDIVWAKPNPMPSPVRDRPTSSHEYLFLLAKGGRYFYDADAVAEPVAESQVGRVRADVVGGRSWRERGQHSEGGVYRKQDALGKQTYTGFNDRWRQSGHGTTRNARSVWTIPTQPYPDAHFATFPVALAGRCIAASTRPGDAVLDPFGGAGTVGLAADRMGRDAVLVELNPEYAEMARRRIAADAPMFAEVS